MGAPVDGNVLGGILGEVFATDVTVAKGRCNSCRWEGVMAQTVVYGPDPGFAVRCPQCTSVLMKVVRTPDRILLHLSWIEAMVFELPS